MRGVAGAGKSSLAKQLVGDGVILSTDHFWMKDGKYQFEQERLPEAHLWNQERTREAMQKGISPIVIDNVNVQLFEMKNYVKMAQEYGYEVEFAQPNWSPELYTKEGKWNFDFLKGRNVHEVPDEVVQSAIDRFDYDATIPKILSSKAPWEE